MSPYERIRLRAAAYLVFFIAVVACSGPPPPAKPEQAASPQPIVVLVSLDGWRWDYLDRANAPNLRALAARGVRAEALIPVFPSKTFPVHYSIVTGLYPEHHGIIANVISDPAIGQLFTTSSATVRDPRWWGGEPVWNTARRQGLRTASMFWPGSDVAIGGQHPHDWHPYNRSVPNADRVRQVLDWLGRPPPERPSFVTLYFSDVDAAGHDAGPDSRDVLDAAARLDRLIGELTAGISRLGLTDRTTMVVVSDHGMSAVSRDRRIYLDDYVDRRLFDLQDSGPVVSIFPRRSTAKEIYTALNGKHPQMTVYLREDMPERLHYRAHPRIPPVIAVADDGWTIVTRSIVTSIRFEAGAHGYDPAVRSMHGIFIAAGPRLREGLVVPAFEAVHVYELLCRLLGITPAKNDGDPASTAQMLKPGTTGTTGTTGTIGTPQALPSERPQTAITAGTISEISLERRCFGCDREGQVVFRRDGTATRIVFGNARSGTSDRQSTAALPGAAFEKLAAAIVSERFFDLRDEYRDPALADGEWTVVTVAGDGRRKSVLNRHGMAPQALHRLESHIETLSEQLVWRVAP